MKAGVSAPVWLGSVDWVAGDTRALQAGLVRAVSKALNAPVSAEESGGIGAARQTNPNAEEAYLRGRSELMGYGPDAARRALDAFQRALRFDTRHAGAHAGISRCVHRSRSIWSDLGAGIAPISTCCRTGRSGTG